MARILIIDDNRYLRLTLTAVIEDYGYDTITAESCEEGLKKIESDNPSLVILDKKLPDGDGLELLKRIKEPGGYKDIPVIMLTAYTNESQAREAIDLGAVAVFTKPFDNDEIVSVIKKVLS